ncbi:uncharacterized protein LOC118149700 isoform X1 [Callithrix jacchus]
MAGFPPNTSPCCPGAVTCVSRVSGDADSWPALLSHRPPCWHRSQGWHSMNKRLSGEGTQEAGRSHQGRWAEAEGGWAGDRVVGPQRAPGDLAGEGEPNQEASRRDVGLGFLLFFLVAYKNEACLYSASRCWPDSIRAKSPRSQRRGLRRHQEEEVSGGFSRTPADTSRPGLPIPSPVVGAMPSGPWHNAPVQGWSWSGEQAGRATAVTVDAGGDRLPAAAPLPPLLNFTVPASRAGSELPRDSCQMFLAAPRRLPNEIFMGPFCLLT